MTPAPSTVADEVVHVGGITTRCLWTEGHGPILVLLHGFGDSADTWRPLMTELAARGRACVAPDLPGFGAAPPLARTPLLPQWDDFVTELIGYVADRSPEGVVVGGNSLGGLLTLRIAQESHLPIVGVVPIAPGGLDRPRWIRVLSDDFLIRRFLALPLLPWPRQIMASIFTQLYLRAGFHRPASVDPQIAASFADGMGDRATIRRLVAVARALALEAATAEMFVERIECPMLVVWGENDRLLSPAGAQVLADSVADAQVALMPECGHCPQVERPFEVAEAVDDFLTVAVAAAAVA